MEKKTTGAKIISIHHKSSNDLSQGVNQPHKPVPQNAFEELLQYFYPDEFHQEYSGPDQRA